jgi:hypothetical protein
MVIVLEMASIAVESIVWSALTITGLDMVPEPYMVAEAPDNVTAFAPLITPFTVKFPDMVMP